MISEKAKSEINRVCCSFVNRVKDITGISPYKSVRSSASGFPIFEMANKEFYEYSYCERFMEAALRDEVINPIIGYLFSEKGLEIELPDRNGIYVSFSNESIENCFPFEFRIKDGSSYVGVRYTGMTEKDYNFKRILKEHKIKRVVVVRWVDEIKYRQDSSLVKEQTAYEFFTEHFDKETADYFLQEVRLAVKKANVEAGFQTIPMLSLKNLSSFKGNRLSVFCQTKYSEMRYQIVEGSVIENWKDFSLSSDDLSILDEIFVGGELYRVFDGHKKYSKCFMTSEYLYSIFKEGNSFDYTAVVSGYLKAVEQLVYEIVLAELNIRPLENVLIKRKTGKLKNYDYVKSISVKNPKTDAWMVPFLPKNEKYFDISLAPLIWLLHDYDAIWRISEEGREMVHNTLLKYSQECRNDHFHKDNIDDFKYVEGIRNNTILLFYLLIGGCKLSNDCYRNEEILGIDREEYSELCKSLYKVPRSENRFIFRFGTEEIKAIRLYDQQRPKYDENGSLKDTVFDFVRVEDYRIDDYETFLKNIDDDHRITLSKDEVPDEILLVIRNGEHRLIYKKTN